MPQRGHDGNNCSRRNLAVLEYLKSQGCPTDEWTWTRSGMRRAPSHLEVAEVERHWLGRRRSGTARGGHLGVVKWLREHGCEWDERVCVWGEPGGPHSRPRVGQVPEPPLLGTRTSAYTRPRATSSMRL